MSQFHWERSKTGCNRAKGGCIVTQLCQCCTSRHNACILSAVDGVDVTVSLSKIRQYKSQLLLINSDLQQTEYQIEYWLLRSGFASHSIQNGSFRKHSSQPVSWFSTEEIKLTVTQQKQTFTSNKGYYNTVYTCWSDVGRFSYGG